MKNNDYMSDVHAISRTKIFTESEETVAYCSVVTMHKSKCVSFVYFLEKKYIQSRERVDYSCLNYYFDTNCRFSKALNVQEVNFLLHTSFSVVIISRNL